MQDEGNLASTDRLGSCRALTHWVFVLALRFPCNYEAPGWRMYRHPIPTPKCTSNPFLFSSPCISINPYYRAHPLPHQRIQLAHFGGGSLWSSMYFSTALLMTFVLSCSLVKVPGPRRSSASTARRTVPKSSAVLSSRIRR